MGNPTWPDPATPGMDEWVQGMKDHEANRPRKGNWMLCYSGGIYYPVDPRPSEVRIADIAHSLSMQCRYGGHARHFYSVAEHSIYVSRHVPEEHALVALMHDATEAYVSDVPRPLKGHLENFAEIEAMNWAAIATAFDLSAVLPDCVHDIDTRLCLDEMSRLLPPSPLPLCVEGSYICQYINCYEPRIAEAMFLKRFDELWNARISARYPASNYRRAA